MWSIILGKNSPSLDIVPFVWIGLSSPKIRQHFATLKFADTSQMIIDSVVGVRSLTLRSPRFPNYWKHQTLHQNLPPAVFLREFRRNLQGHISMTRASGTESGVVFFSWFSLRVCKQHVFAPNKVKHNQLETLLETNISHLGKGKISFIDDDHHRDYQ